MEEFKKGDVVQLKSGGPNMTVENPEYSTELRPKPTVRCQWLVEGKPEKRDFPKESLKKVEESEGNIAFTKDDLMQICSRCNGEGVIVTKSGGHTTREDCLICRKSGYILTEAGEAIASVVMVLQKQGRIR